MKHYFKIENYAIVEAPKTIERNGYTIYGYNAENNSEMLIQDGYAEFPYTASAYEIKDGKIVERQPQPIPQKTVFSKLQIRRACRALGLEDKLNRLIEYNENFYRDWHDAEEIDLTDSMIQQAIEAQILTQEQINQIKDFLQ